MIRTFADLLIGQRFEWVPEEAHHHFPGPYIKTAEDKCIPEEGGYAEYRLWPAGIAAKVIVLEKS